MIQIQDLGGSSKLSLHFKTQIHAKSSSRLNNVANIVVI